MLKSIEKAKRVVQLLAAGKSIADTKSEICDNDEQDWNRVSAKAYFLHLENDKKIRAEYEKKRNVAMTSTDEVQRILNLNSKLADYALSIPVVANMQEFSKLEELITLMPESEHHILKIIATSTMSPKIRALQKKGRFEQFPVFKEFSKLIDAATLSYYRTNFISSYLTLVPIIEGVILRWLDYSGSGKKPDFDELRNFFRNSHLRQPCPSNAVFYNIYVKACHKLLTEHLYKPSEKGSAYSNFNRHLAAHLLSDTEFATKDNCIRLFMFIDILTEIYLYETKIIDPRWNLNEEDFIKDQSAYESILLEQLLSNTPEKELLGFTSI